MRRRQLGASGLTLSVVGLGCNNFGRRMPDELVGPTVSAALDAGITHFDTADIYALGRSEELLGAALQGRRDRAVIATKFGMDMGDGEVARGSRSYIRRAAEASLRRLGTDWIDLYWFHQPDPNTPVEETLAALDELVVAGHVRYIGSSNFSGWQLVDSEWISRGAHRSRFVGAQNQYSLLDREVEKEVVPACLHADIGLVPFFPLANGLLTGKYRRGEPLPPGSRLAGNPTRAGELLTDATFDRLERLEAYARERGITLLDVAISGLAAQPAVCSVIAGATSPEQVRANAHAGEWEPTADDLTQLREILDA